MDENVDESVEDLLRGGLEVAEPGGLLRSPPGSISWKAMRIFSLRGSMTWFGVSQPGKILEGPSTFIVGGSGLGILTRMDRT